MLLQNVFTLGCTAVNLESDDKDEVFEELVDLWAHSRSKPIDRKSVLAAIWDREAKMSTGIKRGIAIPHGKADCIESISGVLGISRKGVDYDALDGEPVHLFFLLLSASKDSEQHLRILKKLARLLDEPAFIEELGKAETADVAHRTLKKYEDILSQD